MSVFKNDIPAQEDSLDMNDFATSIAEFIQDAPTPITIGLQGDWGTGKTSLMNLIKAQLPPDKSYKVDVNTWHYAMIEGEQYLGIRILKALLESLLEKVVQAESAKEEQKSGSSRKKDNTFNFNIFRQKAGNALQQVSTVMGELAIPGSALVGVAGIVAGIGVDGESSNQNKDREDPATLLLRFKEDFREAVQELSKSGKVYFFVDDLDRIRPLKAVEILEIMKNFMDVEGCIFVLAIDYEVVQLGIKEKFGNDIQKTSGKSFFDKIIQLPFRMPTASYNISKYVAKLLRDSGILGSATGESRIASLNFYKNIIESTIGKNPRSIKRTINYTSLLVKLRLKNVKKGDARGQSIEDGTLTYTIACFQLAWPELFDYFIKNPTLKTFQSLQNPEELMAIPEVKRMFDRVADVEETLQNIISYYNLLFSLLDDPKSVLDPKTQNEIGGDGILSLEEFKKLTTMLKDLSFISPGEETDALAVLTEKMTDAHRKIWDNVFLKSLLVTHDAVSHRPRWGKNSVTIRYEKRSIGTVAYYSGTTVNTKASATILRFNLPNHTLEMLLKAVKERSKLDADIWLKEEADTSKLGAGEGTIWLDYSKLPDGAEGIKILNAIFNGVIYLLQQPVTHL